MRDYVSKSFGLYLAFLGFLFLLLCFSLVSFIFFDAKTVAAAPINLIANPSFETATASLLPQDWIKGRWGINTTSFTYPVTGSSNSKAAKVSISSHTSGDVKWAFTPVSVTPGTEYQFRNYYLSDVETHITLEYKKTDGTFIYTDLAHLPPTSSLKETYMRFIAPADVETVSVFHLINQVGSLTVDSYSLIEYTPDPLNLIKNASFETLNENGQPEHWKKGRWGTNNTRFTFPVSGYFGVNSARVYTSANTSGDAKWYHEEIPTEGGKTYTFSDFYKSDTQSYITVQFKMNDDTYTYRDLIMLYPSVEWRNITRNFTTPSGAVGVTVFHLLKNVGYLETDSYSLKNI